MNDLSLAGLFVSALVSATLFPGGSEAVLAMLGRADPQQALLLWAVATAGNTLGGMSTWLLGWWLARRWPPERLLEHGRQRAIARLETWGSPLLLLSWLPIIGDPLCFAAGWLRINPLLASVFMALGKAARYAAVLWLAI